MKHLILVLAALLSLASREPRQMVVTMQRGSKGDLFYRKAEMQVWIVDREIIKHRLLLSESGPLALDPSTEEMLEHAKRGIRLCGGDYPCNKNY